MYVQYMVLNLLSFFSDCRDKVCGCPGDTEYNGCGSSCPSTCATLNQEPLFCALVCVEGMSSIPPGVSHRECLFNCFVCIFSLELLQVIAIVSTLYVNVYMYTLHLNVHVHIQ